jgi:hypothetical protein
VNDVLCEVGVLVGGVEGVDDGAAVGGWSEAERWGRYWIRERRRCGRGSR